MNTKRSVYQLSILLAVLGLVALGVRFATGHRLAAYGSYVVWGLWVAMYLFFAGVAAGSFMVASLDLLFRVDTFKGTGRIALWTAITSLGGGLLSIWVDLGHLGRIWKVFLEPHFGSVMTQMVWGYSIFGVILVTTLYLAIKKPGSPQLRVAMIVGLAVSIFISGAVGALLGVEASRPFWHVGLLPVQFPFFSATSGVAALLVVIGLLGSPDDPRRASQIRVLGIATDVFAGVKLYFLWAFFSQSLYGNVPENVAAVELLLFGTYWWVFWILQILVGTLIPVAVLAMPRAASGKTAGWMGVLVLLGLAVARVNFVLPALAVPELAALTRAFSGPRLQFTYFPSLLEWGVTLGITGFVMLAFLIGKDRLPLRGEEVA